MTALSSKQIQSTQTGIAVRRAIDYHCILGSMLVFVDDIKVASVRYGSRAVVPLVPGSYDVHVALPACRSDCLTVSVNCGEVIELEGGVRWRGIAWSLNLFAGVFCPAPALVLNPIQKGSWNLFWRTIGEGSVPIGIMAFVAYVMIRVWGG